MRRVHKTDRYSRFIDQWYEIVRDIDNRDFHGSGGNKDIKLRKGDKIQIKEVIYNNYGYVYWDFYFIPEVEIDPHTSTERWCGKFEWIGLDAKSL